MSDDLFPLLTEPSAPGKTALRFPQRSLDYAALRRSVAHVAGDLAGATRVAVLGESTIETAVAVVGALVAGVPVVPINPKSGERELEHILGDSAPSLVLADAAADLPGALAQLDRVER